MTQRIAALGHGHDAELLEELRVAFTLLDDDVAAFHPRGLCRGVVDRRDDFQHAVLAPDFEPKPAEFAGRLLGDDADRAAFGVAAEQGALRPAQDFDALDVEQGGVEALGAAHVDAVDIDADAGIARGLVLVEGNDAADAEPRRHPVIFNADIFEIPEDLPGIEKRGQFKIRHDPGQPGAGDMDPLFDAHGQQMFVDIPVDTESAQVVLAAQ